MNIPQRSFAPSRILIVNFGSLSEVVFSLPALSALRKHFQSSQITLAGTRLGCELVSLTFLVTDLLPAGKLELKRLYLPWQAYRGLRLVSEIRTRGFDLAVDLQSSRESGLLTWLSRAPLRIGPWGVGGALDSLSRLLRSEQPSRKHIVDFYLDTIRLIGIQASDRTPRLETNTECDRFADELLLSKGLRKGDLLVGLYPNSDSSSWGSLELFTELARRLQSHLDVRVVVAGFKHDKKLVDLLSPQLPKSAIVLKGVAVGQMVSLLARCTMMISGDGGPGQIAAALGVPTLIIGAPITRRPIGDRHTFITCDAATRVTVDQAFELACEAFGRSRTSALFER
jgi:ADP-heptose:LPS heptosyltransferase